MLYGVKELGSIGVVTDVTPSRLPDNAFSRGKNVRFDEMSVTRSPVFRNISTLAFEPRIAMGLMPTAGGFSTVVAVSPTYQINEYANGSVSGKNGSISTTSSSDVPFTTTTLADVDYINRPDRVPVFRLPAGTNFADLTNWTSTWRTKSLRAFGDFLLAINTTEGATDYPQRVRWSHTALANAIPDSWDATNAAKSAGFNDLAQLKTPLVDGAALSTNFVVYSSDEAYLIEFVGGTFIFNFRKLFENSGVINQNCIVEVDKLHFVFGKDDIYKHDTHTKKSICDQIVKDYIFNGMDTSAYDKCFIAHNQSIEEIMFCYKSNDDMAEFTSGSRCNRAAIYNYRTSTWSFQDLPNVSAATTGAIASTQTYANTTQIYSTAGGTYNSQGSGFDTHLLFVGSSSASDGLSDHSLFGLDSADSATLGFPIDVAANKAPYLERTGIDMDESNPISGQKVLSRVTPQVVTNNTDKTFEFTFGASPMISTAPTYEGTVTFDAAVDYKVDSRASGRYLSYKFSVPTNKDFNLTGFDAEVAIVGRR